MRKILLGTTAVVGLALAAPAAFAQSAPPALAGAGGLTVRLGGYFAFTYGNVSDSVDKAQSGGRTTANAEGRQRSDFRNDAEIQLFVDGRAANGLQYGAVFEMQMDNMGGASGTGTNGSGTGVDFDEMYGFVKGAWGELRFGQEDSAASLMQVRVAGPQGLGADGEWKEFTASGSPYLISGVNDGSDATKIIYVSPQFSGFDVGLSYGFNSGEGERVDVATSTTAYQRDYTGLTNEISAALRYRGTVGQVGIQASVVGMWADAPQQSATGVPIANMAQNVAAYSAGLALSVMGLTLSGEYTWGQYTGASVGRSAAAAEIDNSKHFALGAMYTTGPYSVGVIYGSANQDNGINSSGAQLADRTQTYIGVGGAYTLAPGMVLFANYNKITDENVSAGTIVGTGTSSNTLTTYGSDNTRDITVMVAGVRLAF